MKLHELIALIGEDAARRLMAAYGGEAHYIPKGTAYALAERNRRILADLEAGLSCQQVAIKHRITRRQVMNIKRRHRKN